MRTRIPRWTLAALLLVLGVCPGCVWLQNEFFVYDVAPAPLDVGVDAADGAD